MNITLETPNGIFKLTGAEFYNAYAAFVAKQFEDLEAVKKEAASELEEFLTSYTNPE